MGKSMMTCAGSSTAKRILDLMRFQCIHAARLFLATGIGDAACWIVNLREGAIF